MVTGQQPGEAAGLQHQRVHLQERLTGRLRERLIVHQHAHQPALPTGHLRESLIVLQHQHVRQPVLPIVHPQEHPIVPQHAHPHQTILLPLQWEPAAPGVAVALAAEVVE